jgi:hypothetical protein
MNVIAYRSDNGYERASCACWPRARQGQLGWHLLVESAPPARMKMSPWGRDRDFKLVGEIFDIPRVWRRWQAISSLTPFQNAGISLMRRSLTRSIVS